MVLIKMTAFLFALVLFQALCCTAMEDATAVDSSSCQQGQKSDAFQIEDVPGKAPLTGMLQKLKPGDNNSSHYGFIESSFSSLLPQFRTSTTLHNNTWRITCVPQRDLYTVVMSLNLAYDDYLQLKRKKLTGSIGQNFHSLHFSKRSILVSLVSKNRDIYKAQSSFLIGYVCVDTKNDDHIEKAKLFLTNDKVLEYMYCRPQAFEKIAEQINIRGFSYPDDDDISNMLNRVHNSTNLSGGMPGCTNRKTISEYEMSSADGMNY